MSLGALSHMVHRYIQEFHNSNQNFRPCSNYNVLLVMTHSLLLTLPFPNLLHLFPNKVSVVMKLDGAAKLVPLLPN